MKVLGKGKGKKFTCRGNVMGDGTGGCGSVLLVSKSDVVSHTDFEGDLVLWFACPECDAKTYVFAGAFKE